MNDQTFVPAPPNFSTEIIIELLNTNTGEVEHTQRETNTITSNVFTRINSLNILGSESPRIWINSRRISKVSAIQQMSVFPVTEIATLTPSTFQSILPKTSSTPYIVEYKCLFNPPTTTRTIWSLGLIDANAGNTPLTMVALTNQCTQAGSTPGPGQILAITYRIQVVTSIRAPNTLPLAMSIDKAVTELLAGVVYTGDGGTSVRKLLSNAVITENWNNIIPDKLGVFAPSSRSYVVGGSEAATLNGVVSNTFVSLPYTKTSSFRYGCSTVTTSLTTNQEIGNIFGSLYAGALDTSSQFAPNTVIAAYGVPMVRPTWQPVQNIFSHSVNGTEPFQEISNLGTGSGIINADGISWTNPLWPEYYRVNIIKSGNVGTSSYYYSRRSLTGFATNGSGTGSSWTTIPAPIQILPIKSLQQTGSVLGTNNTQTNSHHMISVHPPTHHEASANMYKLNNTSIFTWDISGITVYDIKLNTYKSYDTTTTPQLPVINITQAAADQTNNIWVCCSSTGLWRIDTSTNVITRFTIFNNITTVNAYAVNVGKNGTVVVVVNGGMFSSIDGGGSWTTLSITHAGITNNNWGVVRWIKIDPNSPSMQLLIGYSSDATNLSGQTCWWSNISPAALTGPVLSGGTHFSSTGVICTFNNTRIINCSYKGSFWTLNTRNGKFKLKYGSNVLIPLTSSLASNPHAVYGGDFMYDYYGSPFTTIPPITSFGHIPVDSKGQSFYGSLSTWTTSHMGSAPFVELSNGLYISRYVMSNVPSFCLYSISPNYQNNLGSVNNRISLNQTHSIYEEFSWTHYGWNGTSWVSGYHSPTLDTSASVGGPFNGTKHRFDSESHIYTGRSCVVVPTVALSTYFTNTLTFATTINLSTNLPGQSPAQQLVTWIDKSTGTSLQLYLTDGNNNCTLVINNGTGNFSSYSSTTLAIQTGSITCTVEAGLSFVAGERVRLAYSQNTLFFMEGVVTSYSGTTLIFTSDTISASTTTNQWIVNLTGRRFGTMPSTGVNHSVVLSITANTAKCYVDGIQLGTTLTIPTLPFNSASGELVIGGNLVNCIDGKGFNLASDFFRGTMENTLIDSIEWTPSNVAAYHTNSSTFTLPTTRVRYQQNQELANSETKLTHAESELLFNGITTRFTNGAGTSFVNKDYYTFGVCNGILKDNATSLTHSFNTYYLPVSHNFSTLDSNIISASSNTVTELVCFRTTADDNTNYTQPGYPPIQSSSNVYSLQSTVGDFTYQATISTDRISTDTDSVFFTFGVNNSTTAFVTGGSTWAMVIKGGVSKGIDIYYNGTVVHASAIAWNFGDNISIKRTAGVFIFKLNATTLYTTSGTQNSSVRVWMSGKSSSPAQYMIYAHNHTLTYSRPPLILSIGNSVNNTGKYDVNFHNIVATKSSDIVVNISGYSTPATVTIASVISSIETLTAPSINTVTVVPDAGYLIFNSADVGKTVTLNCSIIKYPY